MGKDLDYKIRFHGVDRVSRVLRRMNSRAGRFLDKIAKKTRAVQQANRMVTSGLRRVVVGFTAVAAAGILAFSSLGAAGGEFEQSIVSAMAKFGQFERTGQRGQEMYTTLSAKAREMGITTEFTANQSAEALNTLAMAGFEVKQSILALPGVLDIATISGAGLAESADIATGALGAFNLMVDDAEQRQKNLARINDVMANTLTGSKVAIVDFNDAVRDGGAVAAMAGTSIEEYGALLAGLARANLRGSKAGMALKNMYMRLADPKIAKAIKRAFNIDVADAKGDWRDMITILGELGEATKNMGTHVRTGLMDKLFGKRAAPGTIKLMELGPKWLRDFAEANKKAFGMSQKMAKAMRDTFSVEWLNFKAVIDETKISMFEYAKGPMRTVLARTKSWIMRNRELFVGMAKGLAMILRYPKALLMTLSVIVSITVALLALKLVLGTIIAIQLAMLIGGLSVVAGIIALLGALTAAYFIYGGEDKRKSIVNQMSEELLEVIKAYDKAVNTVKKFRAFMRGETYLTPEERLAKGQAGLAERKRQRRVRWVREQEKDPIAMQNPVVRHAVMMENAYEMLNSGGSEEQFGRVNMDADFSGRASFKDSMEITIKDETGGRAEVTKNPESAPFSIINTVESGAL